MAGDVWAALLMLFWFFDFHTAFRQISSADGLPDDGPSISSPLLLNNTHDD